LFNAVAIWSCDSVTVVKRDYARPTFLPEKISVSLYAVCRIVTGSLHDERISPLYADTSEMYIYIYYGFYSTNEFTNIGFIYMIY